MPWPFVITDELYSVIYLATSPLALAKLPGCPFPRRATAPLHIRQVHDSIRLEDASHPMPGEYGDHAFIASAWNTEAKIKGRIGLIFSE
jgi:hypothetical protein